MVDRDGAACLAATLAPPPLPLEVYQSAFGEDEQRDPEKTALQARRSFVALHSIHECMISQYETVSSRYEYEYFIHG